VCARFEALRAEMEPHMFREERVLFPYIAALERAREAGRALELPPFGSVANPIRAMSSQHDLAGELLADLRRLTGGYTVPHGACTSYRLMLQGLEALEIDLVHHVHLENNLLFPRAVALELASSA
jgi:regulator of cell morphogenesis and NO signaling